MLLQTGFEYKQIEFSPTTKGEINSVRKSQILTINFATPCLCFLM